MNPRTFAEALERTFEMSPDEAQELGDVVLAQFENLDEVDDETLDADLRSVFYTLEAKRMLSFRRIEVTREDGDRRRAFFWRLRSEALEQTEVSHEIPVQEDVYSNLPADAWTHHAS